MKADEGIFLVYSLTSKAYRVLNKRSRKIEETYYVTFDDSNVKKLKASEDTVGEIFSQTGQVTASIANLFEKFVELFDEPEKATLSKASAADNKVDHMKELIEDVAKQMNEGGSSSNDPPQHDASVEGEEPSSSQPGSHVEGKNCSPAAPERPAVPESQSTPESPVVPESSTPPETPVAPENQDTPESLSIEGVNADMSYDYDSQSELEELVNAELDPSYDPNYSLLVKWTRDHPVSQVVGNVSEKVLTRSQLKAKQTSLFSKVEFCMFNSFVSKVEPKTVNTALDHFEWVQAMQDELNEFERKKLGASFQLLKMPQLLVSNGSLEIRWIRKAM